jgi:hypothetical protein
MARERLLSVLILAGVVLSIFNVAAASALDFLLPDPLRACVAGGAVQSATPILAALWLGVIGSTVVSSGTWSRVSERVG